jgi:ketosteroid isomerase-like protein
MPGSTARDTSDLIRAHDVDFDDAFSRGAVEELTPLLAPDFVYTHTAGQRQSRAGFLATIAARDSRPTRRLSAITVELHGPLAVSFGDLTISYPAGRADHYLRYVRVHRLDGCAWRLISHRTFEALDRRP